MHIGRITGFVGMMTVGVALLAGCGGSMVRNAEPMQGDLKPMAIVPFFVIEPERGRRLARCPVCTNYFTSGQIAPEASDVITSLFREKLTPYYGLAPQQKVEGALSEMGEEAKKPVTFARAIADKLQVDGVLLGWIFHYRDRVGDAWGVRRPASVAFAAFLFDGKGDIVWDGGFDETQEALTEDVFQFFSFLKRGGKWITARQLASEGVNRMLRTLPSKEPIRINR